MRIRREANILLVSVAASMLIFAKSSVAGVDSVYPYIFPRRQGNQFNQQSKQTTDAFLSLWLCVRNYYGERVYLE